MNKLKYIWIVAAMIVALSACTISYKLTSLLDCLFDSKKAATV